MGGPEIAIKDRVYITHAPAFIQFLSKDKNLSAVKKTYSNYTLTHTHIHTYAHKYIHEHTHVLIHTTSYTNLYECIDMNTITLVDIHIWQANALVICLVK